MAARALKVAEVPKCGLGLVKVVWPFKNGYRLRVSNANGFPFIQMMRSIQRDTKATRSPYLRLCHDLELEAFLPFSLVV